MILPPSIAPFQVVVTPANNADQAQAEAAQQIYQNCLALGLDANRPLRVVDGHAAERRGLRAWVDRARDRFAVPRHH